MDPQMARGIRGSQRLSRRKRKCYERQEDRSARRTPPYRCLHSFLCRRVDGGICESENNIVREE